MHHSTTVSFNAIQAQFKVYRLQYSLYTIHFEWKYYHLNACSSQLIHLRCEMNSIMMLTTRNMFVNGSMMNDDEEGGIRPLMTNMVSMFRHQSAKHVVKNISAWPGLQSHKSPKVASAMIPWLKTTQYPVFINILFFCIANIIRNSLGSWRCHVEMMMNEIIDFGLWS